MNDQLRTIRIEALTRVEGEGGLHLRLRGQQVEEVQLQIYEPPRLFETLLRGRALEDVPDIVARICGICPVAYQMSAVHALEQALQVEITPPLRALRRLFYCGEWIESHALHVYLLHAPDFLGYESGLAMAKDYPQIVERGLKLKKFGNQLLEVVGGRAIHPVNCRVGGVHRLPRREELTALLPHLQWGVEAAVETTRWVANFDFPSFEPDYDMISLVHDHEYPMNAGHVGALNGWRCDVAHYEQEFVEHQVPHSTALHARRVSTDRTYLVGPLARLNLNRQQLSLTARQVADELKLTFPCRNIFQSIVARGLELIHAFEEACQIITDYRPAGPPFVPYAYRAATGVAATEAPRGLLYHRYQVDDEGKIVTAKIVPPTSQNQAQIEEDLRQFIPQSPHVADDDALTSQCEQLVRSYDPCISCSTHFLRVNITRT